MRITKSISIYSAHTNKTAMTASLAITLTLVLALALTLTLSLALALAPVSVAAYSAHESFTWEQWQNVDQALSLPEGLIPNDGQTYEWGLASSGGGSPLPDGLTITPLSGVSGTVYKLTGSPTTPGSGTVYIGFAPVGSTYGIGSTNYVYVFDYTVTEHICHLDFLYADDPATLPGGVVGNNYNVKINAESCGSPIEFSDGGGVDLLPGLTLSHDGVISGKPTAAGTFTFTLIAEVSGRMHNSIKEHDFIIVIEEATVVPKYVVDVLKTDTKGQSLAGATIKLSEVTWNANMRKYEQTGSVYTKDTNSDGIASFSVPNGYYVVTETKAPSGYTRNTTEYIIYVLRGEIYLVSDPDEGETETGGENENIGIGDYDHIFEPVENPAVTFVNTAETVSISPSAATAIVKAKKTDENGALLAGATLRMDGADENKKPLVYDVVTDKNGLATFTVSYGTYTLSEYAAPTGYNATDVTYEIKVSSNGVTYRAGDATGSTAAGAAGGTGSTAAGATTGATTGAAGSAGGAFITYETVTFVNKLIPVLNKDDHFAYMLGYPDGTFGPDRNMTRAEAVVMFSRLLSESMDLDTDYKEDYFIDVDRNEWYANSIGYMHQLGVLADYVSGDAFRPDEPVTRAEFATLAAHFDNLALTDTNKFTDVPDNHWAVKYINSAASKGWIIGYPDNTFKPEDYITRAEIVTLVNRILDRYADETYIAENVNALPRDYTDIAGHWAYLTVMEASTGHDYKKEGDAEQWTAIYK